MDNINHPPHYINSEAKCKKCNSPIECIDITRHRNFNLGNVIKYVWRSAYKGKQIEDLKKARWYIDDEIKRLENANGGKK